MLSGDNVVVRSCQPGKNRENVNVRQGWKDRVRKCEPSFSITFGIVVGEVVIRK